MKRWRGYGYRVITPQRLFKTFNLFANPMKLPEPIRHYTLLHTAEHIVETTNHDQVRYIHLLSTTSINYAIYSDQGKDT